LPALSKEPRNIAWKNQKRVYALFFRCVKETLQAFTGNDKKLRGTAGFTVVLRTHSSKLDDHPNLQFLMPRGGINKKTRSWRVKDGRY
jgi:hypothetical protein